MGGPGGPSAHGLRDTGDQVEGLLPGRATRRFCPWRLQPLDAISKDRIVWSPCRAVSLRPGRLYL
eukprot:1191445-Prorocentrum_minimum.AAC.3